MAKAKAPAKKAPAAEPTLDSLSQEIQQLRQQVSGATVLYKWRTKATEAELAAGQETVENRGYIVSAISAPAENGLVIYLVMRDHSTNHLFMIEAAAVQPA